MGAPHGSHYTLFYGFLRNIEFHACYEDFVIIFSLLFKVNFLIN